MVQRGISRCQAQGALRFGHCGILRLFGGGARGESLQNNFQTIKKSIAVGPLYLIQSNNLLVDRVAAAGRRGSTTIVILY